MERTCLFNSRLTFISLLLCLFPLGFISCGDDNDTDEPGKLDPVVNPSDPENPDEAEVPVETAIVGQWYRDTERFHNVTTFYEDGTGTDQYDFNDDVKRKYSFTYAFESDFMIIVGSEDGGLGGIYLPQVKGNVLYLNNFEDGVVTQGRTYYRVGTTGNDDNQGGSGETSETTMASLIDYGATYGIIRGKVVLDELAPIIRPDVGVEFAFDSSFSDANRIAASTIADNQFTVKIGSISPGTKVYYRPFVFEGGSTYSYGAIKDFTTKNFPANNFSISTGDAEITQTQATYKGVSISNNQLKIYNADVEDINTWECGIVHSKDASMLTENNVDAAIDYDIKNYIGGYSELQYLYKQLNSFGNYSGSVYEGSFDAFFKSEKKQTFYYCLYVRISYYPVPKYILGEVKSYSTK